MSVFWNSGPTVFPFGGIPTAGGPEYTLAADLDGDGDLDLATANTGPNVSLLRNDGQGAFSHAGDVLTPMQPMQWSHAEGLAAADLNGDGLLDLAVADQDRQLGILLGQGSLMFAPGPDPAGTELASAAESVAAADLDGDGDVDLAVANGFRNDTLALFTNDGAAGFTRAASLAVGADPSTVLALDLDGDGRTDLVTANEAGRSISVLRATGPLAFAPAVHHPAGGVPDALAAGDLDGDGSPDLAIANAFRDTVNPIGTNTVTVLPNDGRGGFGPAIDVQVGHTPRGVATGDVDGDGDADLVTANAGTGDVTVVVNEAGTLAPRFSVPSGPRPQGVVMGDFDGRCGLDFAVANKVTSEVRVVLTPVSAMR